MTRKQRRQSAFDLYHVVAKGAGDQIVFTDNVDRRRFVQLAVRHFSRANVKIFAWCLMDNHIHMVLSAPLKNVTECMTNTLSTYALRFNQRHSKRGTLFESPFFSAPIDSEEQLLAAIRYVHQNPQHAGLQKGLAWQWSSYPQFECAFIDAAKHGEGVTCEVDVGESASGSAGVLLGENEFKANILPVDCEFVCQLFGDVESFKQFHLMDIESKSENFEKKTRPRDDKSAIETADAILGPGEFLHLRGYSRDKRNAALLALRKANLSVRQIHRLTGISVGEISRIK
jgi:REP element-mobilizing transposase RayT